MKKILFCLALLLIIPVVWYAESRKIYCIDNQCITVWKTIGGNCYVIPRSYYGFITPRDNYIKTENTGEILIFWSKALHNQIIFRSEHNCSVINIDTSKIVISPYEKHTQKHDSIFYIPNAKRVDELKQGVHYLDIDIFEEVLVAKK